MRLTRFSGPGLLVLGSALFAMAYAPETHAQKVGPIRGGAPLPTQQMSVGPVVVPACGAATARLSVPDPAAAACRATVALQDEAGAVLGQTDGLLGFDTPLTTWYWTTQHDLVLARATATLQCPVPNSQQVAAQPRLVLEFSGGCTTTSNQRLPPVGPIIGIAWSEETF